MQRNLALLIVLLGLLGCFFGCTQMTSAQKSLCFSLASQSYAYIPNCETEQSCYNKVSELFDTSLGYEQESQLYVFKNRVGRSWYFYNKAISEVKTIKSFCQAGNAKGLPEPLNKSRYYMQQALIEMDSAMKQSFEIIQYEEAFLTSEDMDLVKEEPIYFSLIELRQVLSELNSGETNSNTYYSYYQNRVNEFLKSSSAKGFPVIAETTPFWISGFMQAEGILFPSKKDSIYGDYLSISGVFDTILVYFENSFYAKEALANLQNFPISEFMRMYSSIGGSDNSAIKRFALLMNSTSNNYSQIEAYSAKSILLIDELYLTCAKSVEEYNKLSQNRELYSALFGKSLVTEDIDAKLMKIAADIQEVKENYAKSNLTKGALVARSKKIQSDLEELTALIDSSGAHAAEQTAKACRQAAESYKRLDSEEYKQELQTLIDETYFFAQKTKNAGEEDLLHYCSLFVKNKKELEKAVVDYEQHLKRQTIVSKECLSSLRKLLDYKNFPDLEKEYSILAELKLTEDNLGWAVEYCSSLSTRVEAQIQRMDLFQNILAEYKKNIELSQAIKSSLIYMNEANSIDSAKQLLSSNARFSDYFNSTEAIQIQKILGIEDSVLAALKKSNADSKALLVKSAIVEAKDSYMISLDSNFTAVASDRFSTQGKIFVQNNIYPVDEAFDIPLEWKVEFIEPNDCVFADTTGQKNRLVFECLLTGITVLEARISYNINQTEFDELVQINSNDGIIKRTISFSPKNTSLKALILTTPADNTFKTLARYGGNQIPFTLNNNFVEIGPFLLNTSQNLEVFFFVSDIITTSVRLQEANPSDQAIRYKYIASAENMLFDNIATEVEFEVPLINYAKNIIVTSNNKRISSYEVASDCLILQKENFYPGQVIDYTIEFEVVSVSDAYKEILSKQQDYFIQNSLYTETEKINGFIDSIYSKTPLEIAKEIESNYSLIQKLETQKLASVPKTQEIEELNLIVSRIILDSNNLLKAGFEEELRRARDISDVLSAQEHSALTKDRVQELLKEARGIQADILYKMQKNSLQMQSAMQKAVKEKKLQELNSILAEFSLKKNEFDSLLIKSSPSAQNIYFSLLDLFNSFIEKEASAHFLETQNIGFDSTKLKFIVNDCNKLLISLETLLLGREKELVKARFIQPVSESRLKQIRFDFTSLLLNDINKADVFDKLLDIRNELLQAHDSVKSQTISAFNTAVDLKSDETILIKSKQLIDANRFTDAFLMLSSIQQKPSFPYLGFVPLLAIVAVAVVLVHKVRSKDRISSDRQKKLEEEWEKL